MKIITTEAQRHREDEILGGKDPQTSAIIGAAIEVHRQLGPGLLESAYEECLCHELHLRGLQLLGDHSESSLAFPCASVSLW